MFHIWVDGRDTIARRYMMKGYNVSLTFEGFSGADIIVTPVKRHISQDSFQDHLDQGAIMIQLKNSLDFSSSVMDGRLSESIDRMNSWVAESYQKALLITGNFEQINGQLYIDRRKSGLSENAYYGAWRSWLARGGVVHPVIDVHKIQQFIDGLGQKHFVKKDIFKTRKKPNQGKKFISMFKPQPGMSLSQKARAVANDVEPHDLRHILVNLDGVSNKKAQAIYDYMTSNDLGFNMGNFISLLLDGKLCEVSGVGPAIEKKIMKQLGY